MSGEETQTAQGNTNADASTSEKSAPAETKSAETVTPEASKADPVKTEAVKDPKAEQKPEEKTSTIPEKYELKLPEGSRLDAARLEKASLYAKEKGLTQEQAQGLVDRESEAVSSFYEAQLSEVKARQESWINSVKTDKELGGEAYKETAETAHRFIERFGSEALKEELNKTGFGNHPELVRLCARAGKLMADDKFVQPKGAGSDDSVNPAAVLYGTRK